MDGPNLLSNINITISDMFFQDSAIIRATLFFPQGAVGFISSCGVCAAIRMECDRFTTARRRQTAKPDLSLFIAFVFLVIMIQCRFQRHTVTVCAAAAKRLSVFIGFLCERQSCGEITAYYEPSVR